MSEQELMNTIQPEALTCIGNFALQSGNVLVFALVLPADCKPGRLQPVDSELTPHEVRLLKLLVQGHQYKSAAAELGISPHTVSFHLRRVYEKLDVHSKSEAVSKAWRHGLIS